MKRDDAENYDYEVDDDLVDVDADSDANRDPITGATGAHPVGTGVGAAGGGLAGAAIGAAAGPIGAAAGLAAGAIAGGLAGKGIAESVDPTVEDAYWREMYVSRPYVTSGAQYDTYASAYEVGYTGPSRYPGMSYYDAEPRLREDYEKSEGSMKLAWENAKDAIRDGWDKVTNAVSGKPNRPKRK